MQLRPRTAGGWFFWFLIFMVTTLLMLNEFTVAVKVTHSVVHAVVFGVLSILGLLLMFLCGCGVMRTPFILKS